MKKTVTKFLLVRYNFMSKLHLQKPEFTYSACRSLTKQREKIQKFRETSNLKNIYKNELHKACFAHDAAHCDSKDLDRGTISDKILKDKA